LLSSRQSAAEKVEIAHNNGIAAEGARGVREGQSVVLHPRIPWSTAPQCVAGKLSADYFGGSAVP
jgi:hypothetical protein